MKPWIVLPAATVLAASGAPGGGPPAQSATACSSEAATAAGAQVRFARAELAAIPLEADGTLVPLSTSRAIERVKDRLRDFVRAEMACAPVPPEPDGLAAAMAARGGSSPGPVASDPARDSMDRHGGFLAFEVHRIGSRPDMLAVVATLGIKCGSDSMLMLFGRTSAGWRELMVRRSEPYSEVRGGWHDLRFAVSPKDSQGKWFVATVSTTPWCTSAWQGMPYALARPGPAPDRPNVFFRGRNTIYLGNEGDLALRAERDAFEIRHNGSSLDSELLVRRHVRRYAVAGESVRRVPPVAESVRDFVDEWIGSPWPEAKDWSGPDPDLARIHARLHPGNDRPLGGFASIRTCGSGLAQVEIGADRGPAWFFLVRDRRDAPWRMERAARQAAAGCTGPDRLGRKAESG